MRNYATTITVEELGSDRWDELLKLAMTVVAHVQDAEDAVQDTLLYLVEHPKPYLTMSYVATCVLHKAQDVKRKVRVRSKFAELNEVENNF